MPNIQFNYLYRNSANYKNFGSVIFTNDRGIELDELQNLIKSYLIDGTWFYANEWGLPDLNSCKNADDPTWHEFESVGFTDKVSDAAMSLSAFLSKINKTS